MVQEQLVDYISAQVKLGVSADAIKAALVGAGWAAGDVDDTFKKINAGASTTAPITKPAMTTFGGASSASPLRSVAPKGAEPQMIRVSDLVSSSVGTASAGPANQAATGMKTSMKPGVIVNAMSPVRGAITQPSFENSQPESKGSFMTIIWLALVVIFAGAAGYFFFVNMSLTAKIGMAGTQAQSATSLGAQISSLQMQVAAANASNTALTAQAASAMASDQDALANLSLFVSPTGAPATTTITLSGLISGGKPTYLLTTSLGARAYVKNSSVAGVQAVLQPLLNTSTTVQISGTYVPGTQYVTVTTVNGNLIAAPSASTASTSTVSTSATTASSTQ